MNFRGCRTKPGPKSGQKPGAARFARPLRGAEVLVAVRGPSPGEGGGKKGRTIVLLAVAQELLVEVLVLLALLGHFRLHLLQQVHDAANRVLAWRASAARVLI